MKTIRYYITAPFGLLMLILMIPSTVIVLCIAGAVSIVYEIVGRVKGSNDE